MTLVTAKTHATRVSCKSDALLRSVDTRFLPYPRIHAMVIRNGARDTCRCRCSPSRGDV